ncbi:hypothetical protein OIU76_016558 [Salix suchowensis]|nr:hypothetical protein OIU76_016558 [Salix suchowensis]
MGTKILTSSGHGFENECREIHDSWGRLNHLVPSMAGWSKLEKQQIRKTYRAMYGEDMTALLQKMQSQNGIKSDVNYRALVEIFVGRKSSHVSLIKQAYYARFRRHLDQEIINLEPPHPYQKILVALATSHKAHQEDVSQHIAKCDARRLYEAGEGSSRGAIEEAVVLEISE